MIDVDKYSVRETIAHFGEEKQTVVAIEELSELQKELCKAIRGKGNLGHIIEEIADVYIMLEDIKIINNISDDEINEYIELKQIRTEERMKIE